LTVAETAHIFRCAPQTIYALLDHGDLAEVRIGAKRLVDADQLPKAHRARLREFAYDPPRKITGRLAEIINEMERTDAGEEAREREPRD
jgi:hypothetical protein